MTLIPEIAKNYLVPQQLPKCKIFEHPWDYDIKPAVSGEEIVTKEEILGA